MPDHATYNAYLPEARDLYWQQAKRYLWDGGFDAWWCDSSEGFCRSDWNGQYLREPWERYSNVSEELKRHIDPSYANTFCIVHAQTIWDGQRAETSEKRVVNLTRSGYPSIQRYGTIVWSGDISSKWSVLKMQIAEGLRICMSGLPYWTFDIGGFFPTDGKFWFLNGDFNDGVKDPGFRELYTRFLQTACFFPVFRSHGTGTPREIWQFGKPGEMFYDSIARFIRLRSQLIPYIYALALKTNIEDYTMLRSLVFEFPDDTSVRDRSDAFMFGSAFLVFPVTDPCYFAPGGKALDKAKTQCCALPSGAGWVDFWTGTHYSGGITVTVNASIDTMPLFVREGSIVPMTEAVQYADEGLEKPLEIHVFPGADGSFTLYEDAGDGYGYEQGDYSCTLLTWDDEARVLHLGKRQGSYSGMNANRSAVCVVEGKRTTFTLDGSEQKIFVE
jgi:alpha-D-xyloside xylohydrolase